MTALSAAVSSAMAWSGTQWALVRGLSINLLYLWVMTQQAKPCIQDSRARNWIGCLVPYSPLLPAFRVETEFERERETQLGLRQSFPPTFLQYHNRSGQEQEGNMKNLSTSRNKTIIAGCITYECVSKVKELKHLQWQRLFCKNNFQYLSNHFW